METNPFIDFKNLPNFAAIRPEQVTAAVDSVLAAATAAVAAISEADDAPTWENTGAPLEDAFEGIARVWNQVEHMHSVMSTADWQAAHRDNLPNIAAYYATLGQHEGLYERLTALSESPQFRSLSAARQKIINDTLRDFQLSGVALPSDKKTIFRQNSERLALLSAQFEENLLAATNAFSLSVDDAADLGDMPDDLRAIARHAAVAADQDAAGYRFTLQAPSYIALMQYVRNRDIRQAMYRAYNARASELDEAARDNTPVINEIVEKRRQQATLLDFPHYADMALQTRMATSAAAVGEFLNDLVERARPHAEREIGELRDFAAAELGIADLQAWDIPYASEKLRRHRFNFSEAELRPYLREDKILDGLFSCVRHLFGVTVRPAAASLWRDDVRYLELVNSDGDVFGGLYMDLYARDTKRGGAWMADAVSRVRRVGGLQLPVAHITCNFAQSPDGGGALLNWQDVVTLFHECGHALHHLLTEVDDYSVSGISGVEWDAVELPSQWLENFVWDWRVLEPMSADMPRALFDKVIAARRFQSGLWLMRQLEFALFDLSLHGDATEPLMDILATVRQRTAVLPVPADNRFPCGFAHIFAGGYAAGYYSYLWAEVLSADIFAMFQEAEQCLDAALGAQFRRHILAVGGSRPAMESFIAMRGRPPQIAALLAHYGLVA